VPYSLGRVFELGVFWRRAFRLTSGCLDELPFSGIDLKYLSGTTPQILARSGTRHNPDRIAGPGVVDVIVVSRPSQLPAKLMAPTSNGSKWPSRAKA
jgi:hypothetical protein